MTPSKERLALRAYKRSFVADRPVEQVSIRAAGRGDAEAVARLHLLVRRVSMPYLPELHTLDETVAHFASVIGQQTVLVAERGNSILGYCAYRDGWLDHLYVDPAHQRNGIGSDLLERASASNPRLRLWVFQKNVGAIRFYERHGFARIETTDGAANEEREPDALYERRQRSMQ